MTTLFSLDSKITGNDHAVFMLEGRITRNDHAVVIKKKKKKKKKTCNEGTVFIR